ncbi:DNA repair protein endonuclease SAE2/CtIP C-terminus-domain-containing protein [Lyophyllum atratum]|nr:DNA repair protein endonuclease SAE2/CtIP C-terminus-domain-containing protein [Lyophyllum atratum]
MEAGSKTYSKTHLGQRDKAMLEKHQKDLDIRDRKIDRLNWQNDELRKELHEFQARGNLLATSLGFHNIYEAQVAINIADCKLSYRECLERVEILEQELSAARAHNERIQLLMDALEDDQERVKAELADAEAKAKGQEADASKYKSAIARLSQQLKQLQERFDALVDVKERAAERYKLDYAKWRRFRNWIFTEEAEHAKDQNEAGITEDEKRNRYIASVMRKKKMMMELGPNLGQADEDYSKTPTQYSRPPPLGGVTNLECDKENLPTPTAEKKARSSTLTSSLRTSTASATAVTTSDTTKTMKFNTTSRQDPTPSVHNRTLFTVAQATAPSSSPALFNDSTSSSSTRRPLTFHPLLPQRSPQIKQEIGSSPAMPTSYRPPKRQHLSSASSDTEEDSQGPSRQHLTYIKSNSPSRPAAAHHSPPIPPFNVPTSPATSPVHMPSSQTEADSQSQFFMFPHPTPCPPKPLIPANPNLPGRATFSEPRKVVSRDIDSLQPTKMRRLSDEHNPSSALGSATPTLKKPQANDGLSKKGGGKILQAPLSTPANTVRTGGQKHLEDYSAFKGRGRYAKGGGAANETINARFEIDPTMNGGLDFQYDEVVRGKDDRRRMDAGDCECCRDYYEAVGPLPTRLQAPLWRSPPTSPAKPCTRHHQPTSASASGSKHHKEKENRQSEINSHRQAISRHRHHWERAKTPPGYWNIGFPDTQEAEEINERARAMHEEKRGEVEAAAGRDRGRYRRRS